MIQSALVFIFGFVAASLLALLVAPSIWRRAVHLTRKRIESAVPLTANELQAEKDRLRAEHAISVSRLEMGLSDARDALTAEKANNSRLEVDAAKARSALAEASVQVETQTLRVAELEDANSRKDEELASMRAQVDGLQSDLHAALEEAERLRIVAVENEKRMAMLAERVETREGDLVALRADMTAIREKRREEQATLRQSHVALREAEQALKTERAKTETLERRVERSVRDLADLEERLARRERDFARQQQTQAVSAIDVSEIERRAADAEADRQALEEELAELTVAYNRLEKELAAAKSSAAASSGSVGDALLRDKIGELAAQTVHLTALLEGDATIIDRLVKDAGTAAGEPSLADRIRRLRNLANDAESGLHS